MEVDEENVSSFSHEVPRSLNSDISYFGVGGKQAIFFIGNSTRVCDTFCVLSYLFMSFEC